LAKLVEALEAQWESNTDALFHARELLGIGETASTSPAPRIKFVAKAIGILKGCGCSMKDAANYTSELYPIVGWGPVFPESVKDLFNDQAPEELRGPRNENHDRLLAEFERLADEIEMHDQSQLDAC
jgi:hypothetical protein